MLRYILAFMLFPILSVNADLVGYWGFDTEITDNVVRDQYRVFDGEVTGTVAVVEDGIKGKAFSFDGESYITIDSDISGQISGYPFSISCWVKVEPQDSDTYAAVWLGDGSSRSKYYQVGPRNSLAVMAARNEPECDFDDGLVESPEIIDNGQWCHIAAVYGNNDSRKLYVNGLAVAEGDFSCPFVESMDKFTFGCNARSSGNTDFFTGQLDEVRIFDHALTDGEVKEYYLLDSAIGYWSFDSLNFEDDHESYSSEIIGGVTLGDGVRNSAFSFDGSGYIEVSSDILNEITEYPVSIAYWFKVADQGSSTYAALWLGESSVNDRYLQTGVRQGKGMLTVRNPDFDLGLIESVNELDDNCWHHAAAVFCSADDRRLYIDGALQGSSTEVIAFVDNIDKVTIGRNSRNSATDYFKGQLDEVYIYNTELTVQQIQYFSDIANADVVMVSQQQANSIGESWDTVGTWSDGYVPSSAYRASFVSSMDLRAPAGDTSFDSLMLTVEDDLYLMDQAVTVNNITFDGGVLHVGGNCSLNGIVNVASGMEIRFADNDSSLVLSGSFAGNGSITVNGGGKLTVLADGSLYSGSWQINSSVIAHSYNCLGSGAITVNSAGQIDLGYELQTDAALTFNAGAIVDLSSDIAVGALTIMDTSYEIGSYDSLYLYQVYDGMFVDYNSGTGSISVGPIMGTVYQSSGITEVVENLADSDSFGIALLQAPQAEVKVVIDPQFTIFGNDIKLGGTAGAGEPLTLSFDASNWSMPQVVTVQAVADGVVEPQETATLKFTVYSGEEAIGIIKPLDIIVNDSEPTGLVADFDNNGEVAADDLALMIADWLEESGYNLVGESDIKLDDFAVFETQWGKVVRPKNLADYSSHVVDGNEITFNCGLSQVRVSMCNSKMARIQLAPDREYRSDSDPDHFMVQKFNWPQVDFTVSDQGSYIMIATDDMVIRAQKSPFRLQMYRGDNITLLAKDDDQKGMYWQDSSIGVGRIEGPGSGGKFGFGGGDHGHSRPLNKNAGFDEFTVTHGRVPVPFFMSTAGYGIFLNTVSKNTSFDEEGGFYTDDCLDYWFMAGPSFKSILGDYSDLTGRMNLFPKWAYGFMLSKYGNDNATQDEFVDWLDWLRYGGHPNDDGGDGWPIDCYVFDYGWRGAKWNFHKWDESRFYDLESMFNYADSLGFHVGLHNNRGTPEANEGNFTDPDNVQEWWQAHLDPVIKTGYGDWFWPDEFDTVGDNLMANRAAKVVHERWLEYTTEQRPMFITRGGFANQHFACAWSGDIYNTSEEMGEQIVNQQAVGLSGYPWFSHDLGGFKVKPSDNLYIRWVAEFGSFCSIMRAHGHDGREPWLYTKNAQEILRKYLKLRYRLFPYIYSSAWQGTSEGIPMMRAMVLEYQDNPDAWLSENQYFWGDWFLVAPALSEDATDVNVWIPPGVWYDYFSGDKYIGPQNVVVRAELDEIPVFVKGGAIVPMGPDIRYCDEKPLDEITLDIYPVDGSTSYTMYEDDGVTRDYMLKDAYALTSYYYDNDGTNVSLTISAADIKSPSEYSPTLPRDYYCKFNDVSAMPSGVSCDGAGLTIYNDEQSLRASVKGWYYDGDAKTLWVKCKDDGSGCIVNIH